MKKTSTLLAALFCFITASAQGRLTISAAGNSNLRVMVDGNRYTSNGEEIIINNLRSGNHSVKIFKAGNGRYRNNVSNRYNGYQLVYSSNLYVKQQYHVDISINRFGKAFVDEQMINGGNYNDDDDDWGVDNNDQYYDRNSRRAMDNNDFQRLKQSISSEAFDNTKLKVAKQFISANYFTAAQIKELAGLYSFDESRLDIAKYAYDYAVDKGNYFIVNDVFSFSSSKEALMDYIRNRK